MCELFDEDALVIRGLFRKKSGHVGHIIGANDHNERASDRQKPDQNRQTFLHLVQWSDTHDRLVAVCLLVFDRGDFVIVSGDRDPGYVIGDLGIAWE